MIIQHIVEPTPEHVVCYIKNASVHTVNEIRKALLDLIPTVRIDSADVTVHDCDYNSDIVMHRLGLVPLDSSHYRAYEYENMHVCPHCERGCARCTTVMEIDATGPCQVTAMQHLKHVSGPPAPPVKDLPIVDLVDGERFAARLYTKVGRGGGQHAACEVDLSFCAEIEVEEGVTRLPKDLCPQSVFDVEDGVVMRVQNADACNFCGLCSDKGGVKVQLRTHRRHPVRRLKIEANGSHPALECLRLAMQCVQDGVQVVPSSRDVV